MTVSLAQVTLYVCSVEKCALSEQNLQLEAFIL
jgi:hypothetical protein